MKGSRPRAAQSSLQAADLGQHFRQERLAGKTGIDGHDHDDVAEMQDIFDGIQGLAGSSTAPAFLPSSRICESTRCRWKVADGSA